MMLSGRIGDDPRFRTMHDGPLSGEGGCVLFWMQRSQRGRDNPALNLAVEIANELGKPLLTVFGLTSDYPGAQRRHYRFLVEGLPETREQLAAKGIPMVVRFGRPDHVASTVADEAGACLLVGDENPLRVGRLWRESLAKRITVPFGLVDSDVVVPSSFFPKEEFAARTIRPKIHKVWDEFLKPIPNPKVLIRWDERIIPSGLEIDVDSLMSKIKVGGVGEVNGYRGGPAEAGDRLVRFVSERLPGYAVERNQPTPYRTTELSAHLHFGHISPVTMAMAAIESDAPREDVDSFLEELIVRREVAINFVARNPDYDRIEGCPRWARETLEKHSKDKRTFQYTLADFEAAETHDEIWNASQKEMALTGRMHNYMRMYWAKKILEWSPDAETAFNVAVDLNDRYEMDGRDANGYTGIAWAIGGKHDRPWPERPIYGTVRSMSYDGIKRKLDTDAYLARVRSIERGVNLTEERPWRLNSD